MSDQQTPEEKNEAFTKEYNELCRKHGLQIRIEPKWVMRDDGTFSLILSPSIGIFNQNSLTE